MKKYIIADRDSLAALVRSHIEQAGAAGDRLIRIGVPGGRSADPIVQGVLAVKAPVRERVRLYLVDERLQGDRNEQTLLDAGLRQAFAAGKMQVGQLIVPSAGRPLIEEPGAALDLLYLGVGEDGHVASLFPGSYPGLDGRTVGEVAIVSDAPKPPSLRCTVTYRGFRTVARHAQVHLLFLGEGKRIALERLMAAKEPVSTLPCAFFPYEWFPVDIITDLKERRL
jgi:6-phosphogluconolactonase/glucosamine-6-phosphate isomerase/deaminase